MRLWGACGVLAIGLLMLRPELGLAQGAPAGGAPLAHIALQPATLTTFRGAGTLTLSAASSTGTGLRYQWRVIAPDPSLYTLSQPNAVTTQLNLAAPSAAATVRVALLVTHPLGSSSTWVSFTHEPAAPPLTDLGPLTSKGLTLKPGDAVQVRLKRGGGPDEYLPATPLILNGSEGRANVWPALLAAVVNQPNSPLRVGVLNPGSGEVTPLVDATANRLFAQSTAGFTAASLRVVAAAHTSIGAVVATYSSYTDWGAGYCANITITNQGKATVTWRTSLPIQGQINTAWNVEWRQDGGGAVSIAGPPWRRTLAPGASFTQAGFCAVR